MLFGGLLTLQLKGQRLLGHIPDENRLIVRVPQGNLVFTVPTLANVVAMIFVLLISGFSISNFKSIRFTKNGSGMTGVGPMSLGLFLGC